MISLVFPHQYIIRTMYVYMCDRSTEGGTGILDELAGSCTRLAIYPALAICYQRVVIHASLDTRFKGEGSDLLATVKQLKSH